MISKDILAAHYAEYASQPDDWVANMEQTKRSIVQSVVEEISFKPSHNPAQVVVLGASDKRYLPIHQRVFEAVLNSTVNIKTFDIDTTHLGGNSSTIIEHDVTTLFPDAPYTLVFSHELMKFLTPEEQMATVKNSYQALEPKGLAMHIMHEPSIQGTSELKSWQHRVNPNAIMKELATEGIEAKKLVFDSESDVAWLRKTTVVILQKPG